MPHAFPVRATFSLAGLLLIALIGVAAAMPARANNSPAGQAIVDVAMDYVGSYQGECWPWMKRVVEQATGRTMGFDYHLAYLGAGAVEVPLTSAAAGDIIQIANPLDSGPGADYAGLHTAIVLENHGGGVFTVIDSNSQWDGIVRIRDGYAPEAMAGRYAGLTARAYRFDGDAAPSAAKSVAPGDRPAPPPATLPAGTLVGVATGGDCLNLRTAAGVQGAIITCLPEGTRLTVLSEAVTAGDLSWVQVATTDGRTGWVASLYLEALETTAPATTGGALAPLLPFRSVVPILSSNP